MCPSQRKRDFFAPGRFLIHNILLVLKLQYYIRIKILVTTIRKYKTVGAECLTCIFYPVILSSSCSILFPPAIVAINNGVFSDKCVIICA